MKKLLLATTLSLTLAFNAGTALPVQAAATTVYIAPDQGEKYHAKKTCRGLNKANSVKKTTLAKAKKAGYEPCKICKPKK